MKLYYTPGACSLAPHIVLRESGQDFALERVDIRHHTTEHGTDYYAINPRGQVPLLELDDGERLSEGPVIAQFIADRAQAVSLLPAAGMARYRVMEWQNYITSELHKSFTPLFNPELDGAARGLLSGLLRRKFEWVDARLANRTYLTGDAMTVADAYLFTVSNWARHVALELEDLSGLQAFRQLMLERPAVRAAMQAEGLAA